jgi:hypothetical protein
MPRQDYVFSKWKLREEQGVYAGTWLLRSIMVNDCHAGGNNEDEDICNCLSAAVLAWLCADDGMYGASGSRPTPRVPM